MSKPIYQIIKELMDERNLSIADIAKICDVPDSTVRGIVTRKQRSIALEVAFKISDGLGVSMEFLNGIEEQDIKKAPPPEDKDAYKIELIENYDSMNKAGQKELLKLSRLLLGAVEYKKCGQSGMGKETA